MSRLTIEDIRAISLGMPHATEDVKWGADLCFSIGGKMFCVTGMNGPLGVSFKVPDEDFEEVSQRKGFMPAHYVARYKWVTVTDMNVLTRDQLEQFIRTSYDLVSAKLPRKVRQQLGLS
jgi:predicted DNA-binding protein (MmcQ/YjbR family)